MGHASVVAVRSNCCAIFAGWAARWLEPGGEIGFEIGNCNLVHMFVVLVQGLLPDVGQAAQMFTQVPSKLH